MEKRISVTHPYNNHPLWLYYDDDTKRIVRVTYDDPDEESVDISDEEIMNVFERDLSAYLFAYAYE